MKELDYLVLDLEQWNNRGNCWFCDSSDNKAVCQIRVRSKATDRIIQNSKACESCKEKYKELPKCDKCGRLRTRLDYICACIRRKEDNQEKELPILPHERRPGAFYERQINNLREELTTAEVEKDTHLEALGVSEDWHKRQKQELLDKIKELEAEVERLKKLTPQEPINEVESYKEEVTRLKIQLEKSNSQQSAQIEVKKWPWSKIRK
jgi:hypothetical protein